MGTTILVAEDEAPMRKYISSNLKVRGYGRDRRSGWDRGARGIAPRHARARDHAVCQLAGAR
jgi:hypothetical protein